MNEPTLAEKWRSWSPYLLSILRIIVAFLFIQFGTGKIFALPAAIMPEGGTATFNTQAWWAGFLETFGGFFILLGWFTRPVAFLLSGEMAFAYFIGHAPQGFWPVLNQGHSAILFCFIFLYFSAVGAGPWSLDAWRGRGRTPAP